MYVMDIKELEDEGVSITEIKQSLEIECFDKIFSRSSDLPKKFKDKALNICQELREKGSHSFITETNYSYTIWQEKNISNQKENKPNLTHINEIRSLLDNKEDSVNDSLSIDSEKESNSLEIENEQNNQLQVTNNLTANNFHSAVYIATSIAQKKKEIQELEAQLQVNLTENETISNLPSTIVQTYRGVTIETKQDSLGVQIASNIAANKKKVRTYRGIVY